MAPACGAADRSMTAACAAPPMTRPSARANQHLFTVVPFLADIAGYKRLAGNGGDLACATGSSKSITKTADRFMFDSCRIRIGGQRAAARTNVTHEPDSSPC